MINKNEIKKELYKTKVIAHFSYYCHGTLYYTVNILEGRYQFPILTVDPIIVSGGFGSEIPPPSEMYTIRENGEKVQQFHLSSDLGTTPFLSEIKASELIRWIDKAIDKEEFILIAKY